jgi:hypothetical protein
MKTYEPRLKKIYNEKVAKELRKSLVTRPQCRYLGYLRWS